MNELKKYVNLSKDGMQNRADACMIYANCFRVDEAENQYRRILNG